MGIISWRSESLRMLVVAPMSTRAAVPTGAAFLTVAMLAGIGTPAHASQAFAGLSMGQFAVGYRQIYVRDYERGWAGIRSTLPYRPIILRLWYPAKPGGKPMNVGAYVAQSRAPAAFQPVVDFERSYSTQSLKNAVGHDSAQFDALLNRPVPSSKNAPPANGSFPIVAYSLGQDDYLEENLVLANYLASHGYIFVTVPQLGSNERRMELFIDDPNSYEAQVRDLEAGIAAIPGALHPDRDRVGAIGMSMGGIYALLLAMQNPGMRCIVGLDASYMATRAPYEFDQKKLSYYDPLRIEIPILSAYRSDESNTTEDIMAMTASDRYLVKFSHTIHVDFNSYPWYSYNVSRALLPNDSDLKIRSQGEALANLDAIDNLVLQFLDATLKSNRIFKAPRIRGAVSTFYPRRSAPTEEDLAGVLMLSGYKAAESLLRNAIVRYPGEELLRFKVMNRIGYEFIYTDRPEQAVSIFKLNVLAHPSSSDAYESLGEGLESTKDKTGAISAFKTALILNPQNTDALTELKKLQAAGPPPG